MPNSKRSDSFNSSSLSELQEQCEQAIEQYKRSRNSKTNSSSCVEILRRAAHSENEAIGVILLISRPLIEKKCPSDLRVYCEDIIQIVNIRLIKKFQNQNNPFKVTTFPKYRVYLNTTISNVIYNFRVDNPYTKSLENLRETQGFEPEQEDSSEERENLMELHQLLSLLDDPQEYDIMRRRYGFGQKSATIASELRIDINDVYRITERAVRRLKKQRNI